ncbi:hypothetical protein C4D60_Mb00t05580 [Musa balbisiana]|uniref:Uncharacterized protein n=1 Tax=Musa balbisiana TaxID=52838 RepID=A0A4S8I4T1_MUSBA|nr:hypothetical protein C4D60_Mb00t05580 [Musa balbisiana]
MAPTDQSRASKRSSGLRQDLIPSLRGLLYYIKVAKIKSLLHRILFRNSARACSPLTTHSSLFGVVYCKRKQEKRDKA